jgi:hypothetical protein
MNQQGVLNDSEKILVYVKTIKRFAILNKSLKEQQPQVYQQRLHEKFGEFRERYPTLFQLIVDNPEGFEERRLVEMLRMRERVSQKNVSYENASIQIGQRYFDEFVKPIIGNSNQTAGAGAGSSAGAEQEMTTGSNELQLPSAKK